MRRARVMLLGLLALCGCGRTQGFQSPDPRRPATQEQGLDVDASADFTFCHCHHGVGPGFHGEVRVTLSNPTATARRVSIPRLEVESPGPGGKRSVYATNATGLIGTLQQQNGARQPVTEFTVPAQGTVTFITIPQSAYFDGPQTFADVEHADLLRVVLSIDGKEVRHESGALTMDQEP